MGDIGSRRVRYEVLPSTPVSRPVDRGEPARPVERDPHPAPARTEPARP